MTHGGWVHSESRGDRRVRFASVHLGLDETRQVERRETVALVILSNLGIGVCGCIAHDHGYFIKPCSPGGTKSLGTEVDSVAPRRVSGMHDDGLQDAVLADVVGEFFDLRIWEFGTRIVRVFVKPSQVDDERTPVATSGSACR